MIDFENPTDFVKIQLDALKNEQQAEKIEFEENLNKLSSQDLQEKGLALNKLKMFQSKIGLYGRNLVSFSHQQYKKDISKESHLYEMCKLPNCKIQVGDSVSIFKTNNSLKNLISNGIVFKKSLFKIVVSFDDIEEDSINNIPISIVQAVNDVTYKRYLKTIDKIQDIIKQNKQQNQIRLIQILLNKDNIKDNKNQENIQVQKTNLNQEQEDAIKDCLNSKYISLIHGPPGTGKTSTVCELIQQLVKKKLKVLACAGSNLAVDNMVDRLYKKVSICRVGHPARMSQNVQMNACLDYKIRQNSCFKEIQILRKKIKECKRNQDIKQMKKDLQEYEIICIKEELQNSQVVCCTNTGAMDRVFERYCPDLNFDVVIIDECAQAIEISCWIPILRGKKIILAGDHLQLPPTIKSNNETLQYTLFDRIQNLYPQYCTLLKEQYRMNELIMNWSSEQVYDNNLKAAKSVQNHSLNDNENQDIPVLVFIDTAYCELGENKDGKTEKSKYNEGESDLVNIIYQELKAYNIKDQDIGIITPYNAQVSQIRKTFQAFYQKEFEDLEISTVDGFQGREKDCIIISMVRSNPQRQVGFLSEFRRMNVAVTRAKKFICIIGDSECVSSDEFLKNMVQYFQQYGDIRTAQEYKAHKEIQVRFQTGNYGQYVDNKQVKNDNQKQQNIKKQKNKKKQKQQQVQNYDNQDIQQIQYNIQQNDDDLKQDEQFIKYEKQIKDFINNQDLQQLKLENLNSYQRKLIHDICDEIKISHQSIGNGKLKNIILTKQMVEQQNQQNSNQQIQIKEQNQKEQNENQQNQIQQNYNIQNQNQQNSNQNQQKQQNHNQQQIQIKEQNEGKKNDQNEIDDQIQEYREMKRKQQEQQQIQIQKQKEQQKIQKKQQKQEKKQKKAQDIQKEEDDMEFLNNLIKDKECCKFSGDGKSCQTKVIVMGYDCKYCGQRYCISHSMPEKHGCGDDASQEAKFKFQSQYQYNNLQGKNHVQLEQNMKQKINNLQSSRKPKDKKDKK